MSTTPTGPDATRPRVEFTQEIRFAVVMYGGISLAIYINGVAQELLSLVRSTARYSDDDETAYLADDQLSGSEHVYRHLGRVPTRKSDDPESTDKTAATGAAYPATGKALRTRFVVDIVTGASAGGINAVYLAKALANDQDMKELKKLWVTEGDIGMLVNDEASSLGLNFPEDKGEPWSLLNSRRIYLKLLEALRGMDEESPAPPPGQSPLVDDLDLYITATDIAGRRIRMRLADDVVDERRHRNVFHFRHRRGLGERDPGSGDRDGRDTGSSNFGAAYNAFLAFAARATSAHQAAFAPVSLDDITPVVGAHAPAGEEYPAESDKLRIFYRDYLLTHRGGESEEDLAKTFRGLWFNDGGTLDNKPFSFVSQELPLRQAVAHVDRKLLYVEPSPEQVSQTAGGAPRPRIAGNAWAGLSTLPRYETIVEDLTRLQERNRLVQRVNRITTDFEDDIKLSHRGLWPMSRRREVMKSMKLGDLIVEKGAAWGTYQRLRIGQVTDDLTLLVARAAGFDEESEEFSAIRELVRQWRRANYDDHGKSRRKTGGGGDHGSERPKTEIAFLIDYDYQWTMRRVRFVIRKIDELYLLDTRARKLAKLARQRSLGIMLSWPRTAAQKKEFRESLSEMRKKFNKVLSRLRAARREYCAYRTDLRPGRDGAPAAAVPRNPFCDEVDALGVSAEMLKKFIKLPTREECEEMLKAHLDDPGHRAAFDALVETVRTSFDEQIEYSRKECRDSLRAEEFEDMSRGRRLDLDETLPYILLYYYNYFEDFDQVSYPAFYSTDVGEETDHIDVFRVSPWDAHARINERDDKVQKLAGTTFANFGAFFERKFRINDIMWGRLDGAERIIAALLPADKDKNLRCKLTGQAHRAIIWEEMSDKIKFAQEHAEEVYGRLGKSGRRTRADGDLYKRVQDSLESMKDALGEIKAGRKGSAPLEGIEEHLAAVERGQAGATDKSAWPIFLRGFVSEFRPFVLEFLVPLDEGVDTLDAFRNWFLKQYEQGRRFTTEATLETAVRANRVLGGMIRGYFTANSRKRRAAIWVAQRIQMFANSALQPGGEAHLALRKKLTTSYQRSLLPPALLVGVLLLLLLWATFLMPAAVSVNLIAAVFINFVNVLKLLLTASKFFASSDFLFAFAAIFFTFTVVVTLLVTLIPLSLTAAYELAWRKFKGALSRRLERLLSP